MSDSNGRDDLTPRGLALLLAAIIATEVAGFSGLGWLNAIHARREAVEKIETCKIAQSDECGAETLKASIRSADATQDAADMAFGQLVIGFAGLIGVGFTVFFAAKAWKAAQVSAIAATTALEHARTEATEQAVRFKKQLKAATDAAVAAQRHVEVAEDTARKRLRAYVYVEAVRLHWYNETTVNLRIVFRNSGQTPALDVKAGAKAEYGDVNYRPAVPTLTVVGGWLIGAASSEETALGVVNPEIVVKANISRENILYITGRMEFMDIFGVKYESDFGFYTGDAVPPRDKKLSRAFGYDHEIRELKQLPRGKKSSKPR